MEVEEKGGVAEEKKVSEELHALCLADVEAEISRYEASKNKSTGEIDLKKLIKIIDKVSMGKPFPIEDWEALNDQEQAVVQSVKRAYKRSPKYKDTLVPSKRGSE
jgi:hypothetical protein